MTTTTFVFALLLLGQFETAPSQEQLRQAVATTFKTRGYELTEAGVIAALQDRRDRIAPMIIILENESIPKTPAIHYAMIEAFRDEFLIENTYFPSGKEEGAITFMAGALVRLHETGWEDIAMAELPQMGQTTTWLLKRGDGFDDSRARDKAFLEKGPSSRQEIELKAAQIEKARQR